MHDDNFHSAAKPQDHLQGGMEMPHTQMPAKSESEDNPRSAATENIGQTWDSTSLKPGHTQLNPTNDKNMAS